MNGKPLNHPDYRIERTRLYSFSRWSRENVPKPPPAHKVGDRVLVELVVHKVYDDCDGTPLFAIGGRDIGTPCPSLLHGYSNESLTPSDWPDGQPPYAWRSDLDAAPRGVWLLGWFEGEEGCYWTPMIYQQDAWRWTFELRPVPVPPVRWALPPAPPSGLSAKING